MSTLRLPDEEIIVDQFDQWRAGLASKRVVVRHRTECDRVQVLRPMDQSRYFASGRRRIMARLRRRLGQWFERSGLLLTLTFDPKRIALDEAWRQVGARRRAFVNKINLYRRRRKMPRRLAYVAVLEQQANGYPHVHLVFPGLAYLAPIAWLSDQWAQGPNAVDINGATRACSPVAYVCKYISKMSGWETLTLALCKMYRTRLYSVAHAYAADPPRVPQWAFLMTTTTAALEWLCDTFEVHGATVCIHGP